MFIRNQSSGTTGNFKLRYRDPALTSAFPLVESPLRPDWSRSVTFVVLTGTNLGPYPLTGVDMNKTQIYVGSFPADR